MRICTEKTETEAILPISDEALELCGEVHGEGVVFAWLRRCMIQHPLHAWIKAAGIRKHITFHLARHCISSFLLKTKYLQNLNSRQVTIWKRAKFPYLSYSALLKRTLNFDCKSSENFQVSNSQRLQGKMVLGEDSYGHSGDKYFWPLSYSSAKTAQKRMDKLELAGIRCKLTGYNSGCIEFLGYTPETEALLEQERQEVIVAHQAWQAKQVLTA